MDVEKTIEFLLAEGARLDARQQQLHEELNRAVRLGIRAYRLQVRQRLEAEAELRRAQERTDAVVRRNARQQRQTNASLQTLLPLFERHISGPGHIPAP